MKKCMGVLILVLVIGSIAGVMSAKTEGCPHANIVRSGFLDVQSIVDNGDGTHTETGRLLDFLYCADCGEFLGEEVRSENHSQVERHHLDDTNTCACGYHFDCSHEKTRTTTDVIYKYFYDNGDGKTHTMVGNTVERTFCDDCGKIMSYLVIEEDTEVIQDHFFLEGDECFRCGYQRNAEPAPVDPTVEELINKPGNVTGDSEGEVNGVDVLRLAKALAGQEVEINRIAADLNGDGKVDGRDLLRLVKFLAGIIDSLN